MITDAYERLAAALDRLPNGYPRTPSGVELRILAKIMSPEEAALAATLVREYESVETIAARAGRPKGEATKLLMALVRRGAVWLERGADGTRFRLAPFVVGLYEAQLHKLDHELAHMAEEYFANGGAKGIMGAEPALHRVLPAHGTVESEAILPYDDVRTILLGAKSFRVQGCICREEQKLMGRPCAFPNKVCLSFSSQEAPIGPDSLAQEAALALLDEVERVGLVHTVSNVAEGVGYICNCCGCCCGILRGITEWGLPHSVAHANYYAVIDPEACQACGTCVERCQVKAISERDDGVAVVNREACIGCGLCVTGCPNDVARLELLPETEAIHPPADFAAWEEERLRRRRFAS